MTSINTELKQIRLNKGLSQNEISQQLNLPQSHFSKMENGKTDIRLSTLLDWAHALDIELMAVPKMWQAAVQSIINGDTTQKPLWHIDEDSDNE